jgi:hypothetical protein
MPLELLQSCTILESTQPSITQSQPLIRINSNQVRKGGPLLTQHLATQLDPVRHGLRYPELHHLLHLGVLGLTLLLDFLGSSIMAGILCTPVLLIIYPGADEGLFEA